MKFLIQKIDGKVQHDFSFTLLKSIEYFNWVNVNNDSKCSVKYLNCHYNGDFEFKEFHINYVPIGSVEFVLAFLNQFHCVKPKPINIPEELFSYACRDIKNINHMDLENEIGKFFLKSNDKIKGLTEEIHLKVIGDIPKIPAGNYQLSELIDIESEWRCFVYMGELVGMQYYSGDFKMFPCVEDIENMIKAYKSAPVAYTLDIGIHDDRNFVIECHDFFSCGLYGFADHRILPFMFYRWFKSYIKNI